MQIFSVKCTQFVWGPCCADRCKVYNGNRNIMLHIKKSIDILGNGLPSILYWCFPWCNAYLSWLLTGASHCTWVEMNKCLQLHWNRLHYSSKVIYCQFTITPILVGNSIDFFVRLLHITFWDGAGSRDSRAPRFSETKRGNGMEAECFQLCRWDYKWSMRKSVLLSHFTCI